MCDPGVLSGPSKAVAPDGDRQTPLPARQHASSGSQVVLPEERQAGGFGVEYGSPGRRYGDDALPLEGHRGRHPEPDAFPTSAIVGLLHNPPWLWYGRFTQKPFRTRPALFVPAAELDRPALRALDDAGLLLDQSEQSEIERLLSPVDASRTGLPVTRS